MSAATVPSARWRAQRTLAVLRDQLLAPSPAYDAGLAARHDVLARERDCLLARLAELGRRLQEPATDDPDAGLARLVADVEHHLQRRRDLAWDDVELELGGSE